MDSITPTDAASPPLSPGTTTRATPGLDDTAQPALTSGFGTLMEQEREIQSSTERYVGEDHGEKSAAINRILQHQQVRLGANIALLEERYEMLPNPGRFHLLPKERVRLARAPRPDASANDEGFLPSLVAQHMDALRRIVALSAQRPDGQRGELILAEIARNHEEMAWMLTALIKEDESVRDLIPSPTVAEAAPPTATEATWENEGGAPAGGPAVGSARP
jgi:hypothetical protein